MTSFTEAAATLKTIASKIPPPIRGLATFLLIYGAFFAAAIWFEIIYTIIPAAIFVAAFTIRQ